ncbi:hypothetical protein ACEXQB_001620 [Herbiconiux sp. P18]|uniref:hypothetical protein n=1 Tax=Herbiconiux liangxiaofengii TaxID=3342795 RepID=UPI0035BA105B
MTNPQDDAAHRRATAAQEFHTYRSRSLWALTILGVILIPAVFAGLGTFFAFFTLGSPISTAQITQGAVAVLIGSAVQLVSAIGVFSGAAKHRMVAQTTVAATWLILSVCAVVLFFSIAARY